MKKALIIILFCSVFIGNAFSYEMTQKDLDISEKITEKVKNLILKKWDMFKNIYINILAKYKEKYKYIERRVNIIQKSIDDLTQIKNQNDIQKSVILQMTTLCENAPSKRMQYNYAENIGDWRGITFWIIWFTTGTFDWNILLHHYTDLNPNNNLKKYISTLDLIDKWFHDENWKNDDITGLESFIKDINNNKDPLFKKAQLDILESMYWNPAVKLSNWVWAKYPLTLWFIYDMTVNHGESWAFDLIEKTNKKMGWSPKTWIDEKIWLGKLMDFRHEFLKNEYPDWIDRVIAFRELLTSENLNLKPGFQFSIYWGSYVIDGDIY